MLESCFVVDTLHSMLFGNNYLEGISYFKCLLVVANYGVKHNCYRGLTLNWFMQSNTIALQ